MKLKPKKFNPPRPDSQALFNLSLQISNQFTSKTQTPIRKPNQRETIKTPKSNPSRVDFRFCSHSSQIPPPSCKTPPKHNPDSKKPKMQTRALKNLP